MKILRISGSNLASLAGSFELDFEAGPLAEAGLFAISGPTGSGKSTLLDALCLALYDRTPRLEARSSYKLPDVGDQLLGAHDSRTLLRRGTTEGFAEVHFLASDGRRYRARWSVRRARSGANGRLQDTEVALFGEDNQQTHGLTKTEALAAIEAAVGLSFDQFRRSILLAQGDFAAFLKAKSDERSELLERMTGTKLYSDVSKLAFERNRAIEEQLRLQEQEAKSLLLLSAEARATLEAEEQALAKSVAELGPRLTLLRHQHAWWVKEEELQTKLKQAQSKLAQATARSAEAEPRRRVFADIEQVQPLRRLSADAERTAVEAEGAARKLTEAAAAAKQATALSERDAQALSRARRAHDEARAEADSLKPMLDAAKALDQSILEKTKQAGVTAAKLKPLADQIQALTRQGAALTLERDQLTTELASLKSWLELHAGAATLAEGWTVSVKPQLEAFVQGHGKWAALLSALPTLEQAHAQAELAEAAAQRAFMAAEATAKSAQEAAQEAEAADAPHLAHALSARRTALTAAQTKVAQQERQRELAEAAERERDSRLTRREADQRDAAASAIQAREAAAARDEVERQLAGYQRLRDQLGLEAHRQRLIDGEPCPLCGALEHPGVGPIDATAAALEEQSRQLAERSLDLQREVARLQAVQASKSQSAATLGEEIEARQAELAQAEARWKALGGEGECLSEQALAWLNDVKAQAEVESKSITEQEQALEALRGAAAEARTARDQAQARLDQARGDLKRAEAATHAARAELDKAAADRDAQRAVLNATLESLSRAFDPIPRWRTELEEDPSGYLERWTAKVIEARDKLNSQAAARARLTDLTGSLDLQSANLRNAQEQHSSLHAEQQQQLSEQAKLRAERKLLLEDQPVTEVEQRLESRLKASEQAVKAADEEAKKSQATSDKKGGELAQAQQSLDEATLAKQAAAEALAHELTKFKLTPDELHARLAPSDEWITTERAALAKLAQEESTATQLAAAAADDLATHQAQAQNQDENQAQALPKEPRETIQARLRELEPLYTTANQELGAKRSQLKQDTDNRAEGEARARKLEEARQQAHVWQQLNTLIGSSDGKKFRKFAQSLTLELLLAHANAELTNLSPRYRLQRVATQDLELQVLDRDMGDEVRSTLSLSGGEAFLVSLALALGLSSLASQTVRIESLFVDEGFGSLDPHHLELAVSALDALQSVGRKVGLISHVPGLAERIGVQVKVEPQGNGASKVRVVHG